MPESVPLSAAADGPTLEGSSGSARIGRRKGIRENSEGLSTGYRELVEHVWAVEAPAPVAASLGRSGYTLDRALVDDRGLRPRR